MRKGTDDGISELVDNLYRTNRAKWEVGLTTAQSFLKSVAADVLQDKDLDRLSVKNTRIKDPDRTVEKIRRKASKGKIALPTSSDDVLAAVSDLIGIKVLCKSPRDLELFAQKLDAVCTAGNCAVSFAQAPDDYASSPKPSGYRAYHAVLAVEVPTAAGNHPVKIEVQVKTRLQDAWGELTHEDLYKPGEALKPTDFHQRIAKVMADMLAQVDSLADALAGELDQQVASATDQTAVTDPSIAERSITTAVVRTTGPRYALAVGPDGQRGLIPARTVRDLLGVHGLICVADHVHEGDNLRVAVQDSPDALYFHPLERAELHP